MSYEEIYLRNPELASSSIETTDTETLEEAKDENTRLKQLGLDEDSAKRIAFSRKKYWRLSCTPEVHRAITTRKLRKWGLMSLTTYAESAYSNY